MNAFEVLGVEERLEWSEEALREAFRQAGRRVHPDAGGKEGDFAVLKEAFAIVASPSRRLRHWLELRGMKVELRGVVGPDLMDLFGQVGTVTQRAEGMIRRRDEAKSALARAMLEAEAQVCREEIEEAIVRVEGAIAEECERFQEIEMQGTPEGEAAAQVVRDLAFLEKWRSGLRSAYARLV